MARIRVRWISWLLGVVVIAVIAWSFRPQPVSVEVATVTRGPLVVTIDEDARTRVRDRFTVSAPVSGYLRRIAYQAGSAIRAGQTVAFILPAPPTPIDIRSRAQLEARVEAATDGMRQAQMRVESARAALAHADRELERRSQLARTGAGAPREADIAQTGRELADADLKAAVAGVNVAEHDLQAARAALIAADNALSAGRTTAVRAPRGGFILKVFEQSERVVTAGTPLVDLGDASELEIVADLLSTDAVRVSPGVRVLIDRWGGDRPLNGRVRLIEPSSFTKVSALGVEEQRVNVVIDFTDPPAARQRLGDGFALEVRVVTWEGPDVLTVPIGALFRRGDEWMVFTVVQGRARAAPIRIGHRNSIVAEALDALMPGDQVVVHPSERVSEGARVDIR